MKTRLLAGLLVLIASFPAYCEKHALLMLIGEYQKGIPALDGTKADMASSKTIAREMGVSDANIRAYTDKQLTLDGMRKAFDELEQRIQPNDQVFIYFSGHGTRRKIVEDGITRCGESIVTVEGDTLTDAELEVRLARISKRASKLIMLADSCHSGGLATRTLGANSTEKPKLRPKSIDLGGGLSCSQPVNALTRSISAAVEKPGTGGENYVFIAAARDNEVSFDTDEGGLATRAWRDCMNGGAKDLDGSGGLTAEEIEACAQDKIAGQVDTSQGYQPHHVSITGNRKQVLKLTEKGVPSSSVAKVDPLRTLQDMYNSRDDRRKVRLEPVRPQFRIDKDDVEFSLTSSHAGYVYLLMVGSDGKTFDLLFPNQLDRNNQIRAGEVLRLPRPNWAVRARGPAGKNHLLALVTDSLRDFSQTGMRAAGPFSVLQATANSASDVLAVSDGTNRPATSVTECSDQSVTRTLEVQRRCSNAYGAALTVIEETR